jgi:hypothetical protein
MELQKAKLLIFARFSIFGIPADATRKKRRCRAVASFSLDIIKATFKVDIVTLIFSSKHCSQHVFLRGS